jgi:hypothetical protein
MRQRSGMSPERGRASGLCALLQRFPGVAAFGRAAHPNARRSKAFHCRRRWIASKLSERLNECDERETELVVVEVLGNGVGRFGSYVHLR